MVNAWEQRKLGEVTDIFDGTHQTPKYTESGVKFVSVENISNLETKKYISQEAYEKEYSNKQAEKGDVLMTRIGDIGTSKVIETDQPLAYYVTLALLKPKSMDSDFLSWVLASPGVQRDIWKRTLHIAFPKKINLGEIDQVKLMLPGNDEQKIIGQFFKSLDNTIALHQREHILPNGGNEMLETINKTDLFHEYYSQWIIVYKEGAIRKVTLNKYYLTLSWLKRLIPNLKICDLNRITYQKLLNDYAEFHEKQTTIDFHHQLKAAIKDAVDEGFIEKDPTRKAIIKGKVPKEKKPKYLNHFELQTLLSNINLQPTVSWDWLILLIAKTGLRFSEALALTPNDFDFSHQVLIVNKTWDYKGEGGFLPTKNRSSVRKVQIDWHSIIQFSELIKNLPQDEPIFVLKKKVYNSTINDILARHCKNAKIPIISIHGLRHTHASILLFAGVSIASVARRLGHSSMTTTQKTYLHIIQELENKDTDLVMRSLSGLMN